MNQKHLWFAENANRFHTDIVSELVSWIDENIDSKITLSRVASKVGYSQWHFQRIFKQLTGLTLGCYITRRRLEIACQELSTENLLICDLAYDLGYDSHQSFNRIFKREMGITPSEYRACFSARTNSEDKAE